MASCSPNKVYDLIRRRWVAATPEEKVRQKLLQWMLQELRYPRHLIAVEKKLSEIPHLMHVNGLPSRRADILCLAPARQPDHSFYPLLLIECKRDPIDQKAIEQMLGYNYYLQAPFFALADEQSVRFGFFDKRCSEYTWSDALPPYQDLWNLKLSVSTG